MNYLKNLFSFYLNLCKDKKIEENLKDKTLAFLI
jgi:hypothetical protein